MRPCHPPTTTSLILKPAMQHTISAKCLSQNQLTKSSKTLLVLGSHRTHHPVNLPIYCIFWSCAPTDVHVSIIAPFLKRDRTIKFFSTRFGGSALNRFNSSRSSSSPRPGASGTRTTPFIGSIARRDSSVTTSYRNVSVSYQSSRKQTWLRRSCNTITCNGFLLTLWHLNVAVGKALMR